MQPSILDDDIEAVTKVLKSGMLIQGKEVEFLESAFSNYNSVSNAIALSNGTATLHLALIALGVGEGDEVIVPAFSYIATANVVELVGAIPVFVDINIGTFNIDVNKIEAAITPKTKVIMPVHEFGLVADMDQIMQIAKAHNLFVIEDAACALGSKHNNKFAGTWGDFGSFSLHPRKAITSGEGGVLITSNDSLARQIKIKRNHGVEIVEGKMEFVDVGYNYRMTDFQAALVNSQFKRLDHGIKYKQSLAQIYFNEIKSPKVRLPFVPSGKYHTWQTFHVLLDDSLDRDEVILKLREAGIGTNYGAQCMPFMKYYQQKYKLNCEHLYPEALRAFKQGLALPLYEKLTEIDIKKVCDVLNKIL